MKLSIVIPAHNEELSISECLSSITENLDFPDSEIIVINNASTDKTKEVAEKFQNVRVIDEREKGLTKARQRGLKEAKGELISYLDADTKIPIGWSKTMMEAFVKNKNLVCLSGPPRYYDLKGFGKFMTELFWRTLAPFMYHIVGYMAYGANFTAKRNALIAIGGFDSNIKFHGEDTDIARRLSKVGKVVFSQRFFIYGSGRRFSGEGVFKTNLTYGINFLWEVIFHKPFSKEYKDIRKP
jgi:glycosyltransferase involved in cell wall biosynthesis